MQEVQRYNLKLDDTVYNVLKIQAIKNYMTLTDLIVEIIDQQIANIKEGKIYNYNTIGTIDEVHQVSIKIHVALMSKIKYIAYLYKTTAQKIIYTTLILYVQKIDKL